MWFGKSHVSQLVLNLLKTGKIVKPFYSSLFFLVTMTAAMPVVQAEEKNELPVSVDEVEKDDQREGSGSFE